MLLCVRSAPWGLEHSQLGGAWRGTRGWAIRRWHSQGDRSPLRGGGMAHLEGKVLGAAGASVTMHLQEGSQEPEDAML